MPTSSASFQLLAPGLGQGTPPPGWEPIVQRPLLILVGLTGVGKSTALAILRELEPRLQVLPDRRTLTDQIIIPHIQSLDGEPLAPVRDRTRRFDYTRRYRERYPGGMAHALAELCLDPARWPGPLCFDGLRGENEVTHAVQALPRARFALLHAPDALRVERLVRRRDAFDRVTSSRPAEGNGREFHWDQIPGAETVFSLRERQDLERLVRTGQVSPEELRAKVLIVVTERRNYDPLATLRALQRLALERTQFIDTAALSPEEVAQRLHALLRG